MKFVIDTETLRKEDIGISGCLYLIAKYLKDPINEDTFKSLHQKGLVILEKHEPLQFELTYDGTQKAEYLLVNDTIDEKVNGKDRYYLLAEKLRDLYPSGKKPGTHQQWKDSTAIIATRLKTLVKKYNVEFTDEQAIQATTNYIKSFNGNYQFMHVLKYFIFKNTASVEGVEQNSQLLSYIENLGQEDSYNNDWTVEVR